MTFLNFEKHLLFVFVIVTGILQRQTKLLCLAWKYVTNLANFNWCNCNIYGPLSY